MKFVASLICIMSIFAPCYAASFQDVAGQKKGSGDTDLLFFKPQNSTQNTNINTNANASTSTKLSPQQKADEKPQSQKPGKWATSIRGIKKR